MGPFFITGVSGFLGSRLAFELLNNNIQVIGITRNRNNHNISDLEKNPLFKCLEGKITTELLNEAIKADIKGVFHLAAQIPLRYDTPYEEYYKANVDSTKLLIDFFGDKEIDFFLYASTSSVFGQPVSIITEDTPPTPMDNYGLTKYVGEKLLEFGFKNSKTKKVIVRFQSIFGAGDSYGIVNNFYKRCKQDENIELPSGGKRLRNLISIEDAVKVLYHVLSKFNTFNEFEIFQAASCNSLSVHDIALIIKNRLNSNSEIALLETKGSYDWDIIIDTKKIHQVLGLQISGMEEGISQYIKQLENEL